MYTEPKINTIIDHISIHSQYNKARSLLSESIKDPSINFKNNDASLIEKLVMVGRHSDFTGMTFSVWKHFAWALPCPVHLHTCVIHAIKICHSCRQHPHSASIVPKFSQNIISQFHTILWSNVWTLIRKLSRQSPDWIELSFGEIQTLGSAHNVYYRLCFTWLYSFMMNCLILFDIFLSLVLSAVVHRFCNIECVVAVYGMV